MYINHFGFTEKPFKLKPDPRFFYSTSTYQQAQQDIVDGIHAHSSLIALVGSSGSGKTMLLERCQNELGDDIRILKFNNTTLPFSGILDFLCESLDITAENLSIDEKIKQIQLLTRPTESHQGSVLFIDDAHNLSTDTLNDLLSIGNPPNLDNPLFSIVISGLPELSERLGDLHQNAKICQLAQLQEAEVESFIAYQLQTAGHARQDLFTPNSVEAITTYTHGNPRTINSLCDAALFIATMEDQNLISPEIVEKAARQCFLLDHERVVYEYPEERENEAIPSPDLNSSDENSEDEEFDNLPPELNPQFNDLPEDLSYKQSGEVLGLRIGDVSSELEASGFNQNNPDIPAAQSPINQPFQQTFPAAAGTDPDATAQVNTDFAAAMQATADSDEKTVSKRIVISDDFGSPMAPSTSLDQASHQIVSGLTTVGGDFKLQPTKRRRSYRWLRGLLTLIVFFAIVIAAVWIKPELFDLTRDEVNAYAQTIQTQAKNYSQQALAWINSLQDKAGAPAPKNDSESNNVSAPAATPASEEQAAAEPQTATANQSAAEEQPAVQQQPETEPEPAAESAATPLPAPAAESQPSAEMTPTTTPEPMAETEQESASTAESATETLTTPESQSAGDSEALPAESESGTQAASTSTESPTVISEQNQSETAETISTTSEPVNVSNDVVIVPASDTEQDQQTQPGSSETDNMQSGGTTETDITALITESESALMPAAEEPASESDIALAPESTTVPETTLTPAATTETESIPEPAPEPTPEPIPELTPELTSETTPLPALEPIPEPTPLPASEPAPETVSAQQPETETSTAAVDSEQIANLLVRAQRQLRERLLTTPENDNAFSTYQQILQLDPENADALEGFRQIQQTYKSWAEQAVRRDDLDKAREYYLKALTVDPEDNEIEQALNELQQRIQSQ